MFSLRIGFALSIALAVSPFCCADTVTIFDGTDHVQASLNGGPKFDCGGGPETCFFGQGFAPVTPGTFFFNIYSPDGTLSDTLVVNAFTTAVNLAFASDIEGGVPLVALAGGTSIVEDGTIQLATTVPLVGGGDFVVQFQSDLEPAPEPRGYAALLALGVLGIAGVAKLRRRRHETA
jgi:hypothetical protein